MIWHRSSAGKSWKTVSGSRDREAGVLDMKIVVTGATGFLGSALCRELAESGHQVTAVVRPESVEKAKSLTVHKLISLPLEELEKLGQYTDGQDLFYHLAWNGSGGNARNDYEIQLSNLVYLKKALEAAKECGCHRLIGAGSQAEYGVVNIKTVESEAVPTPFMMYGAAKLSCLHMGRILAKQLGITFIWPRIYSVYGPRECDPTLLGYVVRTLREGGIPELGDCDNMWDFMYITDFTKAMRILGEHPKAEGIYNVASGNSEILRNFVEKTRDTVKPGAELGFGMRQTDEKSTFWLETDISRLKELGFRSMTAFEDGICNL